MDWPRVILHLDMDAFYAAVEQRDRPELRGKPILVGGGGKRGVVTTASYEARVFGCRSAMPTGQALRLCPQAIVVPIRMDVYAGVSRQVRTIIDAFTPDVEPISIDEAFIELTHVPTWRERPMEAARAIKRRIREELRLTASVGISGNKFLAKVASDLEKPDGLTVIDPAEAAERLAPMPVGVLWGVGKVAAARLSALGVRTVADLLGAHEPTLVAEFGRDAIAHWKALARGEDDRTVQVEREARSIGKERTFGDDIGAPERLRAILLDEVEQAARTLRDDQLLCGTVSVKLRRPDFRTFTRSRTLATPSDRTDVLWAAARELLDEFLSREGGTLRLLGVSLQNLTDHAQAELFGEPERQRSAKIDAVADAIAEKFGRGAIRRAGGMDDVTRRRKTGRGEAERR
jgi:DNA polymerase-4